MGYFVCNMVSVISPLQTFTVFNTYLCVCDITLTTHLTILLQIEQTPLSLDKQGLFTHTSIDSNTHTHTHPLTITFEVYHSKSDMHTFPAICSTTFIRSLPSAVGLEECEGKFRKTKDIINFSNDWLSKLSMWHDDVKTFTANSNKPTYVCSTQ